MKRDACLSVGESVRRVIYKYKRVPIPTIYVLFIIIVVTVVRLRFSIITE
jgi:hypothetical protein